MIICIENQFGVLFEWLLKTGFTVNGPVHGKGNKMNFDQPGHQLIQIRFLTLHSVGSSSFICLNNVDLSD